MTPRVHSVTGHERLPIERWHVLATPPGALYVVTHVDVVPPRREETEAALKALAQASRAAEGNLRFEVLQQDIRRAAFFKVNAFALRSTNISNTPARRRWWIRTPCPRRNCRN